MALRHRLRGHIQEAKRGATQKHLWVTEQAAAGTLEIWLIADVQDADPLERHLIKTMPNLFNKRVAGRRSPPSAHFVLLRPISIEPDSSSGVLITCPSLPEVTTFAENPKHIIKRANDAIEEALWARSQAPGAMTSAQAVASWGATGS